MKTKMLAPLSALIFAGLATSSFAGDLGINVILSGEISPGVYGQVELGNNPRPRVVYEEPRVVVVDKRYVRAEPVYLSVPPGHIKHWDKHCREYNACSRKVYFVRSSEYDSYEEHEHHDHEEHGHHGHGKGKKH